MKKSKFREYLIITFGIILVALSIEYFYAPNNIAAGGVTGIAIIINAVIPSFSIGVVSFILNGLLFIVALIFIDGKFGVKTIYASLGLSVIIWAIERFLKPVAITNDLMMATIFGTLISAFGMAIIFNENASTGGNRYISKNAKYIFSFRYRKIFIGSRFCNNLSKCVCIWSGCCVVFYAKYNTTWFNS